MADPTSAATTAIEVRTSLCVCLASASSSSLDSRFAALRSARTTATLMKSVPRVLGCHRIRSRGPADHVFLDLHVWMDGATPLIDAHAVSHEVKDRLMDHYPQITDAIIHIEPPPLDTGNS